MSDDEHKVVAPADWDRVDWEAKEKERGQRRMARVLEYIPSASRHLDVGTGNGDGTLLASDKAVTVGLEYGLKSAAIARSKGCNVVEGDARNMPFDSATFDVITCLDVLEHIPDHESALKEMARVLRPGARLILQTPNAELFKERLLRLMRRMGFRQKQPYDCPLPLAVVRSSLCRAGLRILVERPIRYWSANPLERLISWSRLFVCKKQEQVGRR